MALVLCSFAPRGVNAEEDGEDGVSSVLYRPTFQQCQERVSEAGKTAGRSNVGWHVSSLCSAVTMWWPGNERRCCQTVLDYVSEGGGPRELPLRPRDRRLRRLQLRVARGPRRPQREVRKVRRRDPL